MKCLYKWLLTSILITGFSQFSRGQFSSVSKCPSDEHSHKKRAIEFSCTGGKKYHCMKTINEEKKYVEFCMRPLTLYAKDGCPVIRSIHGEEPDIFQRNCSVFHDEICLQEGTLATNMLYKQRGCLELFTDTPIPTSTPLQDHHSVTAASVHSTTLQGSITSRHFLDLPTSEKNVYFTRFLETIFYTNQTVKPLTKEGNRHYPVLTISLLAGGSGVLVILLLICFVSQFLQIRQYENHFPSVGVGFALAENEIDKEENFEEENVGIYDEIVWNYESENVMQRHSIDRPQRRPSGDKSDEDCYSNGMQACSEENNHHTLLREDWNSIEETTM